MVTWDDFDKIWASTSPLTPYEFSEPNYSQGWNFVGSTPPARQMWDSIQKKNDEKFKFLRDNFGTPHIVTQASDMTDTDMVYVYMGSEAGWNSGHWYYYDEGTSSWADGGVYNSVAFVTDPTLSIAGQPADAKAVGDALALKADLAGCTFTGNVTVTADLSVTGTSTLAGDVTASSDLSVAGDSALTNLSVSGTTALAGTSTAPTPSADDNSTKIATTEYVQNEVKPIETDVDIAQKDIANIKALLQGHLYNYQTDTNSSYTKSVPSGAMPYAGLEKVGGKTIVYNQLCDFSAKTQTKNGITWTKNADNSYTANGDSGDLASDFPLTPTLNLPTGHKILIKGCPTGGSKPGYFMRNGYGGAIDTGDGVIITIGSDTRFMLQANVWAASVSNVTFHPLAVDLTLMFGAGNEPTIEQFNALFPASYYPYNAGTLLSAGVTSVISKDSTNTTLQTYSIPAEIQALDGYGWSAGTAYNYVDFERKVFVQNVARVDISSLNSWDLASTNIGKRYYIEGYELKQEINIYSPNNDSVCANIVCSRYATTPYESPSGMSISYGWSDALGDDLLCIYDNNYNSLSDWKTAMSGVYFYYELATPVETDISEYLTDDNLIQVEAGGTITFPNSNGTDYQIPVPSEEEYMIDLQSAIGE